MNSEPPSIWMARTAKGMRAWMASSARTASVAVALLAIVGDGPAAERAGRDYHRDGLTGAFDNNLITAFTDSAQQRLELLSRAG